jgi:hypothetical protein
MNEKRTFFLHGGRLSVFGSFGFHKKENLLPSSWLIIRFWIIWVSQEENVLPSIIVVDYWFLDHLGFTRRERSSFNHRGRLLVFGSFGFHKKRMFFLQSSWSTIGFWIIWVSQEENVLPSSWWIICFWIIWISQKENLLPSSWLIIRFWIIWVSQEENVLPSSWSTIGSWIIWVSQIYVILNVSC